MLGFHLVLVMIHMRFTMSIKEKTNRIGDTKHNIYCTFSTLLPHTPNMIREFNKDLQTDDIHPTCMNQRLSYLDQS